MNGAQDERWEARVRDVARALAYPPTPDIAAGVRSRLAPAGGRDRQAAARRRRLALAGAALALLLGLLAVPQVRAAVLEVLRLGAIRILQSEPAATAGPGGAEAPTPTPLPSVLDLAGETSLEEARRRAGFAVRLPTYPPDLGLPDQVFLQDLGGPVVVLVWLDEDRPDRVALSLHQLGPGTFGDKFQPPVVRETQVGGRPAVWTEGPYLLRMRGGEPDVRRLVTGHVLVWVEGEVTYRLETDLELAEAVRIAESLE